MPPRKYPPKIRASVEWNDLVDFVTPLIVSSPPAGKKKITNMYWNPDTLEVVMVIEE